MKNKKTIDKKKENFLKYEELSWKKISELNKNKTVFFLPISPIEEHGPHLPVGTDFLIISDAVKEALKIIKSKKPELTCVLMPTVPLGFCKFNTDFPGSISINSKIVRDIILGIGDSLGEHGFKYFVVCTYHMALGHLRGIYSAINKLESKYNIKIVEPWGPYFYNNMVQEREPKLGFDTSKELHAGFRETSVMKYLYPYLVDESFKNLQNIYRDINSPKLIGKKFKDIGINEGYIGSPARADADYGRWFFSETVNMLASSTLDLISGKKKVELPRKIQNIMKAIFWQ
jgi:creatinine amidohydrolase